MKEEINSYDYGYEKDQVVMLNAIGLLAMIDLLNEVVATQPRLFSPLMYAEKTEEIKDDKGNVIAVNTDWKEHNPNSFFMSAVQENGAVPGLTPIAFKCEQMRFALESIHKQNIEKGIAKKITELEEKNALSNIQ